MNSHLGSVEKLIDVWDESLLQQTVSRLEPDNPGLPICTCVPLDHVCTGNLYFAVIPGMGEIDQENCLVVSLTSSRSEIRPETLSSQPMDPED